MNDDAVYRAVYDVFWEARQHAIGAAQDIGINAARPSVLYRPTLVADGSMWCALYGDDLQVGVAGFGETPDAAMRAFDQAWVDERTPDARRASARGAS